MRHDNCKGKVGRRLFDWYIKYGFSTDYIDRYGFDRPIYLIDSDVDAAWEVYGSLLKYYCFSKDIFVVTANVSDDIPWRVAATQVTDLLSVMDNATCDHEGCTSFAMISHSPREHLERWLRKLIVSYNDQDDCDYEGLYDDVVRLNEIATGYAKMLAEVCGTTDLSNTGDVHNGIFQGT